MSPSSLLVAELGPTNTGKTWRAIERMLEHDTGMMGLPLRLLAREVYDKVTARVGEARVALVTGEEKRVPAHPSYWICTVEAMPVDQPVDFLAVDEIQLCAHRERGHVFTDRLLHARGRRETWFLGAESMRPVLRALFPDVMFRRSERLSQLRS
ncbi:MAG TPA: helicase, partial [Archangium sp.]